MNGVPMPEPPLVEVTNPRPELPVLVAGLASVGLMNGSGEFVQSRETRGAPLDWGGVYGQGVRLTGAWRVQLRTARASFTLAETLERLRAFRWGVESQHRTSEFSVTQEVVALAGVPGVGRRLSFEAVDAGASEVVVDVEVEPFLAPVIVEGIKPYSFVLEGGPGRPLRVTSHGSALVLESDRLAGSVEINGEPWTGGSHAGELTSVRAHYRIPVRGDNPRTLDLAIWGGPESAVRELLAHPADSSPQRSGWVPAAQESWARWLNGTPTLRFPSAPELETAYGLARGALRTLYTRPNPEMTGLLAGYPWYSAIWCRDLAWMLPAVIWMGDPAWATESIRSVFRFQARSNIPILGAETGELPMQISPGPIFLYGTSDTSLYYPALVRRVVNSTGQLDLAAEQFPALRRIDEWASRKRDPDTGLFTNGGEVAALRAATQELGRVHIGFDSVDTTIWDSTDRRDHAIDLQVLLIRALADLGSLGESLGLTDFARDHRVEAQHLAETVGRRYYWPEESYWFDSLRRDGTPVRKLRPNALQLVSAGLVSPDLARTTVQRAGQEDLSTPWGVRTLSARAPTYDPTAYHDGQVWTIATAWAARAALRSGDADRGLAYLQTIAGLLHREYGFANECYRGDQPVPFNSCFLLGFSIAPFLSVLFDSLWGLEPRMLERRLEVNPCFPAAWGQASIDGLRLAEGRLDLTWNSGSLRAHWVGAEPITLGSRGATVKVEPDHDVELRAPSASQTS